MNLIKQQQIHDMQIRLAQMDFELTQHKFNNPIQGWNAEGHFLFNQKKIERDLLYDKIKQKIIS